jgi:5,10-methylene-tetrahydrofolate dehydrogenase/methenyl tetrahydrofolate cyclohydrolase
MGVAAFVKAEMVKPGAVVIDVGVNRIPIRMRRAVRGWWATSISTGVQPNRGKDYSKPGRRRPHDDRHAHA